MLHNEGGLARVEDEALDDARGDQTLLGIEVAVDNEMGLRGVIG